MHAQLLTKKGEESSSPLGTHSSQAILSEVRDEHDIASGRLFHNTIRAISVDNRYFPFHGHVCRVYMQYSCSASCYHSILY